MRSEGYSTWFVCVSVCVCVGAYSEAVPLLLPTSLPVNVCT